MKYSIVIPSYNSEKWIASCVNSVLAQKRSDYSIVVLDSGSTDGTIAWLSALGCPQLTLVTTDSRLGIEANWKRILDLPLNEYLTILGHDDRLHPDYLSTMDKLIAQYPDAGLYQSHFDFIDENNISIRTCKSMPARMGSPEFLKAVMQNQIDVMATGFLMRSADYKRVGGIPSFPQLLYADIILCLELIHNSYLAVSPNMAFSFRSHLQNTSKSVGNQRLEAFDQMITAFQQLAASHPNLAAVIQTEARSFLTEYARGNAHKLLYIPTTSRNGMGMHHFLDLANQNLNRLVPGNKVPISKNVIQLPLLIDRFWPLKKLFLWWKSFQKRTY